jgi:hypothetical protein
VIDGVKGTAVHLWSGTGKAREGVPSKNLEVRDNIIRNAKAAVDLTNSTDYYVGGNTLVNAPLPDGFASTKQPNQTTGSSRFLASQQYKKLQTILATRPKGYKLYRDTVHPVGLQWIQFDEYSPRDFRSSLAAYRAAGWGALDLYLSDPKGTKISAPEWAAVTRDAKDAKLAHIGTAKIDPAIGALRPYTIKLTNGRRTQEIRGNLLDATWQVKWFRWDDPKIIDPSDEAGWSELFSGRPILEQTSHNPEWGKVWSIPAPDVPVTNYAFVATTRVKMPSGTYKFAANYAGGMRIRIDGKDIINNWKDSPWMQYGESTVEIASGDHEMVVQSYREKGGVFLKFYWGQLK